VQSVSLPKLQGSDTETTYCGVFTKKQGRGVHAGALPKSPGSAPATIYRGNTGKTAVQLDVEC